MKHLKIKHETRGDDATRGACELAPGTSTKRQNNTRETSTSASLSPIAVKVTALAAPPRMTATDVSRPKRIVCPKESCVSKAATTQANTGASNACRSAVCLVCVAGARRMKSGNR